jgi:hypothetical protein
MTWGRFKQPGGIETEWDTSASCHCWSYVLGQNIQILKENIAAVLVTSKESGLEMNAKKIKCMCVSRKQNAGRNNNVKMGINPLYVWQGTHI